VRGRRVLASSDDNGVHRLQVFNGWRGRVRVPVKRRSMVSLANGSMDLTAGPV
jgi:hypothetical protein